MDLNATGVRVVPAVLAGRTVNEGPLADGRDPADPGPVAYRWVQVAATHVDEAVAAARTAGESWRARSLEDRRRVVWAVGDGLAAARGRLIGIMARDGPARRFTSPNASDRCSA